MHCVITRTGAACLTVLALVLFSATVRAETFQTPTFSAPPPPPAMTIPGATPRLLSLGADDRALRQAIDARLGKMIAEVREARAAMLAGEAGPPVADGLAHVYRDLGVEPRGFAPKGESTEVPLADLSAPPPEVVVADVDYLAGSAKEAQALARDFAGFYDAYLAELEGYRTALPARPAAILVQSGLKPEGLRRDASGGTVLPLSVRTALKLEYRYLQHGHMAWKTSEAAYRAEFFSRLRGRLFTLLAARAREMQTLARLRQSWSRAAMAAHVAYVAAGVAEQREIADAFSRDYARAMPRYVAHANCLVSVDAEIGNMAASLRPPLPPGRIYRNPAIHASHLGGKFYVRPGEPDGYGDALAAALAAPLPECVVNPQPVAETGARPTAPAADLGGVPMLGGDCAECDEAKVALTAIEMSLMPLLHEEALLKDRLGDGESADKLLKKYVQADSAAERYASNLDTEARLDADPLTGQKSVLGFWSQVLEESKPTAEREAYLARLSVSCPFSLILAKAGIPGGASLLDRCANGIVEAEKDLRRLHRFEGMNIHYRLDYSEFEGLRNEVMAQEKELRTVPPERRRPKLTAEQEAALLEAVRRALESDPKYAELVQEADEARLKWELRDAAERRLRELADEIAAYEKDRLEARAAYDDCVKQCRARLP